MTPCSNTFREVGPFLEHLYSVTSSEGLEDPRGLREYEDAVNALMRCKPVIEYFEHGESEGWIDEGLEFMSTIRELSEEIIGTFLCDAERHKDPSIPLRYLIEFFDNRTVLYHVKIIFLTDYLPASLDKPLKLDQTTFLSIAAGDDQAPLYYLLEKEDLPIRFRGFEHLAEAEQHLQKTFSMEVAKLLTSLILIGCRWIAIKEVLFGPPYPFWPHEDVRDVGEIPYWKSITFPAKVELKTGFKREDTAADDETLKQLGVEIVKDREILWRLEHGVLAPDLKCIGAAPPSAWNSLKNIWNDVSRLHPNLLKSLGIATKRYFYVLNKRDPEDQIIDFCIFLESLLLKGSERMELTERLCRRAAFLISPNDETWYEQTRQFKNIYNIRSRIVHGKTIHPDELPSTAQLEEYMREILRAILLISLYCRDVHIKSIDDVINNIDKAMFFETLKEHLRSSLRIVRNRK